MHLLDFNNKAHEMFRKWYVDGRLFYQKVIDLNAPERGLTDIRNIDALKIKPVREYKPGMQPPNLKSINPTYSSKDGKTFGKASQQMPARVVEYFLYNKKGMNYMGRSYGNNGQQQTIKIAK